MAAIFSITETLSGAIRQSTRRERIKRWMPEITSLRRALKALPTRRLCPPEPTLRVQIQCGKHVAARRGIKFEPGASTPNEVVTEFSNPLA